MRGGKGKTLSFLKKSHPPSKKKKRRDWIFPEWKGLYGRFTDISQQQGKAHLGQEKKTIPSRLSRRDEGGEGAMGTLNHYEGEGGGRSNAKIKKEGKRLYNF